MGTMMNVKQAIDYLQPIADNAQIAGYQTALNVALDAMREVEKLRKELEDERYRHDRQADFTIGQGKKIDQLKELLRERENPVPLTEDELRQMMGEPVWCVSESGASWFIVNKGLLSIANGIKAYRHKPGEMQR